MTTSSPKVTSPAPRSIWRNLLAHDPAATPYQTPEWSDAACRVGGYRDTSRLYEFGSGQQLVLPMVSRWRRVPRLRVDASMPREWGTGGLVADQPVAPDTIAAVWADLLHTRAARIEVRGSTSCADVLSPQLADRVSVRTYGVHVLDLSGGIDTVWAERFRGVKRTSIRRAERSGVVVEADSTGRLADVYHRLFLTWVERRARERNLPPALMRFRAQRHEPARKYRVVGELLGEACVIYVASSEGVPLAASVALFQGSHAVYLAGVSDKSAAASARANDLLQHRMIQEACARGCLDYNMGASGGVPGLIDFKTRFGAVEKMLPVHSADSAGSKRLDRSMGIAKHAVRAVTSGRHR